MTNTLALVRFVLRRDRVKLSAWVGGVVLLVGYVTTAIPAAYPSEGELDAIVGTLSDPIGRMLVGPGYGFDAPTYERVIANGYGLWIMLVTALMSIFLVVRHTRAEEASGRAELVRADVVGRRAPLTATLVVAVLANVAVGGLSFLILAGGAGYAVEGSALLAASIAAVGLAFAGITAVTVQLSSYPRGASGLAGLVFGVAFVLRGVGDMVRAGGSAVSWFSPLGWAQQSAPFVLDRWWPLLPVVALAVASTVFAFVLSARRDLGGSVFAVRPGAARARPSLGTPLGLAFRLQRASILAWSAAIVVTGAVYGAYVDTMADTAEDLPDTIADVFGEGDIVDGYLAYIATFGSYLLGMFVVATLRGVRTDETDGRTEAVLSAPVGRATWLGANAIVAGLATIVVSALAGVATGVSAGAVSGEWSHVGELFGAQLNQVPAVLVVLAVAVLLLGVAPRAYSLAWVVVGSAIFIGTFGPIIDPPGVMFDLSPFEHPAAIPVDSFALAPVVALSAVAGVVAAAGLAGYRRRDLQTT